MTREKMLEWIDNASYEDLLRKWRFAPAGDPFFHGDVGAHFSYVLSLRKSEDWDRHVAASKAIGWDR